MDIVIQICIVCITIAVVWLISVLIPAIIQIKKTAKEIEITAKSIYNLSEEAKQSFSQVNRTLEFLLNRVKEDGERVNEIVNKLKGVIDIITNVITTPLIKIISIGTGIITGLRFLSRKEKGS